MNKKNLEPEKKEFTIKFGAFSQPLKLQLNNQGLKFSNSDDCEHAQKDADAITRLSVRGILSDSENARARYRLVKRIQQKIQYL